jgi:dTDP-4-dehydrorhamnose reductase
MRVVVIGATGQFGRAMVAACRHAGWDVLALGHESVEVADAASVAHALEVPYDIVVNATVWHGPAQEDPVMALRVNALGARVVADHATQRGATCVTVSTDYVFDGDATCPYDESATPTPRSVYGISKATGEALVRAATPDHLIVRLASLFDVGGSRAKGGTSFVGTMLANARAGRPLRVVNDQVHSPTYAPDAAATTVSLLRRRARGIAHVTNSGWCSWFEMASAIFAEAGISADLSPSSLKDLPPGGPPRPRYSVLAHGALRRYGMPSPRPWREALRDYLAREASIAT